MVTAAYERSASPLRLFISYRRNDNEAYYHVADRLFESLPPKFQANTGSQLKVYLDRWSNDLGEDYEERIGREAADSDAIVVLLTPNYFDRGGRARGELQQYLSAVSDQTMRLQTVIPVVLTGWAEIERLAGTDVLADRMTKRHALDVTATLPQGFDSTPWREAEDKIIDRLKQIWQKMPASQTPSRVPSAVQKRQHPYSFDRDELDADRGGTFPADPNVSTTAERIVYPDGSVYEGEMTDGIRNGQGTFALANGNVYVGEFKDDRANGQGTFTFTDGAVYAGEFKDDNFSGQGTYTFTSGDVYVGEFKDGIRNGQGTYTSTNGTVYAGEFKDGKPNGQGTFTFANGDVYVGEFKDGKANGQGTWTSTSGDVYVGEFKDDKFSGRGTYTFANGTVKRGLFRYGGYLGPA